MKKTVLNIVFIVIFMGILIVPVIFMNTKENQISTIDNKALTEWPGLSWDLSSKAEIESYLDDRIGFREQAIETYIELNDNLFHVMVHPLFMYGQDGHIFYKDPDYITAYQRLNTDSEYLDSMVDFLQRSKEYLDQKNIKFLYYLCPDKKTIYSEYFPESIHVKSDNESVIEHLESKLSATDIPYIIPAKELLEAKQSEAVYNKLYDATHWNELGAMIGHKLIDEKVQEWYDDVPPLTEDDFDLSYITVNTLDVAQFPIEDVVPVYTPKQELSGDATGILQPDLNCTTTTFYSHHINNDAPNGKIVLVFTDSYFANYVWFYTNRYREVYFVHRQNYDYLQYFVNLTIPDMVIFETAERSISSEMPTNTDFTDYYYEAPYQQQGELLKTDLLDIELTSVKGVRQDQDTLYLNTEGGASIISLKGVLTSKNPNSTYRVYCHVGEKYLETDYCALHRESQEKGVQEFEANVQRRFMQQGPVELIAVDEQTQEAYLLATYEVLYE